MKFMMIVKHAEKQGPPPKELMDAITILSEEETKDGTMIGKTAEGIIQGHRMISLAFGDREKPSLGAGRRMNINCPPISDDKTLGTLDASGQQLLEGREENILKLDGEGEQPVQECRDRRKLIL